MSNIKKILISAFLLASSIVLGRFLSVRTPILTIGFSFIPLMLAGIILGPKYSLLVGLLSDLIGAILFPSGAYFFGFTISSALTGLIYGLFLYNKDEFKVNKKFIIKLIICILIVSTFINGILNSIWLIIITKNAAKIIIPTRILKELLMLPIEFISIYFLSKLFKERINKLR